MLQRRAVPGETPWREWELGLRTRVKGCSREREREYSGRPTELL